MGDRTRKDNGTVKLTAVSAMTYKALQDLNVSDLGVYSPNTDGVDEDVDAIEASIGELTIHAGIHASSFANISVSWQFSGYIDPKKELEIRRLFEFFYDEHPQSSSCYRLISEDNHVYALMRFGFHYGAIQGLKSDMILSDIRQAVHWMTECIPLFQSVLDGGKAKDATKLLIPATAGLAC